VTAKTSLTMGNIEMYVIETWIKKKKTFLGPFIYFIRKINIGTLSVK
jgi:hypothetical protein